MILDTFGGHNASWPQKKERQKTAYRKKRTEWNKICNFKTEHCSVTSLCFTIQASLPYWWRQSSTPQFVPQFLKQNQNYSVPLETLLTCKRTSCVFVVHNFRSKPFWNSQVISPLPPHLCLAIAVTKRWRSIIPRAWATSVPSTGQWPAASFSSSPLSISLFGKVWNPVAKWVLWIWQSVMWEWRIW